MCSSNKLDLSAYTGKSVRVPATVMSHGMAVPTPRVFLHVNYVCIIQPKIKTRVPLSLKPSQRHHHQDALKHRVSHQTCTLFIVFEDTRQSSVASVGLLSP